MSFVSDPGYRPEASGFAVFMLIKVAGPPSGWMRGWWGFGDFPVPADATDVTGGIYRGNAFPLDLATLTLAVNGQTSQIELVFSGLSGPSATMSASQRRAIYNAPLRLGVLDLDGQGQRVGAMKWVQYGVCGWPSWLGEDPVDGRPCQVSVPVLLGAHDRNDTTTDYWSPNSQRRRRAGDRFFDQVGGMSVTQMIDWPQTS